MKKILTGMLALAITVSAGITVCAADYNKADNTVAVDTGTDGFSTVLIAKDTDSDIISADIIYINQTAAGNTFDNTVQFMIKENPQLGKYKVTLGGAEIENKIIYFTISDEIPMGQQLGVESVNEENSLYNIGFGMHVDEFNGYNSIKVVINDGDKIITGGYSIKEVYGIESISGSVDLALQINNVPKAYKDHISVYLSTDEVGNELVWKNESEEAEES